MSSTKWRNCAPVTSPSKARARESVQINSFRMFYAQHCASRHRFLRSAEPDIHLQSRAPKSRHRRLSLCSLPVPKQFVESLGRVISFAQSATCRTWQSAHFVHPVYFGSILCRRSPAFFSRHEVSLLPIHGKQICDHLPRYGKCRPIAISFLPFLVINHSHFVVLSRCQLGGFYQRTLDMFIALLRERHTHRLVGRAPFISAEAAVADGLLDRAEA
jgi:hypothetical protein